MTDARHTLQDLDGLLAVVVVAVVAEIQSARLTSASVPERKAPRRLIPGTKKPAHAFLAGRVTRAKDSTDEF